LTSLGFISQVSLLGIPRDDTLVTRTGGVGASSAASVAPTLGFAPALGSPSASCDLRGAAASASNHNAHTRVAATRRRALRQPRLGRRRAAPQPPPADATRTAARSWPPVTVHASRARRCGGPVCRRRRRWGGRGGVTGPRGPPPASRPPPWPDGGAGWRGGCARRASTRRRAAASRPCQAATGTATGARRSRSPGPGRGGGVGPAMRSTPPRTRRLPRWAHRRCGGRAVPLLPSR